MIYIMNLRNAKPKDLPNHIRVDRASIFGNPFFMKDESQREKVCKQYEVYFHDRRRDPEDRNFHIALDNLIALAKMYDDLYLYCWCAPKKCHAETIMHWINKEIK